jgi:very-short-patch-repair endonuclease
MRDPKAIKRARRFRKEPTKTESLLWQRLRGEKLAGAKFRRQADIGSVVVDFACIQARLIVEVDGGIHDHPDVIRKDTIRDHALKVQGFNILRFSAVAIESDLEAVLIAIERAVRRPSQAIMQGHHHAHI